MDRLRLRGPDAAARLPSAKEESPGSRGDFRAGPRGEEWVLEIPWPDASPGAAPPRSIQIARRWAAHVLARRITAENRWTDPRLLAEIGFPAMIALPE